MDRFLSLRTGNSQFTHLLLQAMLFREPKFIGGRGAERVGIGISENIDNQTGLKRRQSTRATKNKNQRKKQRVKHIDNMIVHRLTLNDTKLYTHTGHRRVQEREREREGGGKKTRTQ